MNDKASKAAVANAALDVFMARNADRLAEVIVQSMVSGKPIDHKKVVADIVADESRMQAEERNR